METQETLVRRAYEKYGDLVETVITYPDGGISVTLVGGLDFISYSKDGDQYALSDYVKFGDKVGRWHARGKYLTRRLFRR